MQSSCCLARHAGVLVLLACGVAAAGAQSCFLADLDDDGSLWTIRTECPEYSCALNFILEIPAVPPLDRYFQIHVTEGCCDVQYDGYYGTRIVMEIDTTLVDEYSMSYPTCTCCSSWIIDGHFRADAPMVPGSRYLLGHGEARAICATQPCSPPHDFTAGFYLFGDECAPNEAHGAVSCATSGFAAAGAGGGVKRILGAPAPNPVHDEMTYAIELSEPATVSVRIYDVCGRVRGTLLEQYLPAGFQIFRARLASDRGLDLRNGVYLIRLDAPGIRESRILVLSR